MRRNSMDIVTNKYYILTKKFKIFGNFDTAADAAKEAKDGDVVMCALDPKAILKKYAKVTKIVLDFNNKTVTVEGADFGKYPVGTTSMLLTETCEGLITEAWKACKNTIIIGTPDFGMCLDSVLMEADDDC